MTLFERLAEAEQAFHELSIGQAVVEVVDQNGERIRYAQASKPALQTYIQSLKTEIDGNMAAVAPMSIWGR